MLLAEKFESKSVKKIEITYNTTTQSEVWSEFWYVSFQAFILYMKYKELYLIKVGLHYKYQLAFFLNKKLYYEKKPQNKENILWTFFHVIAFILFNGYRYCTVRGKILLIEFNFSLVFLPLQIMLLWSSLYIFLFLWARNLEVDVLDGGHEHFKFWLSSLIVNSSFWSNVSVQTHRSCGIFLYSVSSVWRRCKHFSLRTWV